MNITNPVVMENCGYLVLVVVVDITVICMVPISLVSVMDNGYLIVLMLLVVVTEL